MQLDGAKVLVTGAGGFIGSHLVEHLLGRGCAVRALVHYDSRPGHGNLDLLGAQARGEIEVQAGDIRDPHLVSRAVEGCQVVFHLAALVGIPYSYVAPSSYVATNIQGSLNLLEASLKRGVERFVLTSTSECYGTARQTPIDEEHRLRGQSPYAASKIAADKLAEAYHLSFGLPVSTLRPFNNYGPRQSPRAVIPGIISQLLWGGESLQLGALSPTRDFLFVADTCEAFCRMAEVDEAVGCTINAGTGRSVSIGRLAELLMEVVGVHKPIVQDAQRVRPEASEVQELECDATLARRLLGWSATVELPAGLQQVADHIRAHASVYRDGGAYAI